MPNATFDVIVVGGGHAGCEAAAAAARMGARTALVTHSFATIGEMSCNPAIGGLGKGHLVREIDALDGLMGRVADAAGIQFRLLNRSKGPAVQGPRAQADRKLYRAAMQAAIRATPNLEVIEAAVEDLVVENGRVQGIVGADGRVFRAGAVVLTTGTFLRGLIHRGEEKTPAGRHGEPPANGLSERLLALDLRLGRLKTGTPARLASSSIDWAAVEMQAGDDPPVPFSFLTERIANRQIECGITTTTEATHALIRANLHRAPMYSGQIDSVGPRYCPSIEDKVVRFAGRAGHQIFLEPEGLDDDTVYPNGVSTSLPAEVQEAFLRTIPGLERVAVKRFGYAIEYDYVDPRELLPYAGSKEAAGPAARRPDQRHHRLRGGGCAGHCRRHQRGADRRGRRAPLRRLARRRLSGRDDRRPGHARRVRALPHVHLARRVPAAPARRQCRPAPHASGPRSRVCRSRAPRRLRAQVPALADGRQLLESLTLTPNEAARHGLDINKDGRRRSAFELLAYPAIDLATLRAVWPEIGNIAAGVAAQLEVDARYAHYVDRQEADVVAFRKDEGVAIPIDFDFAAVAGLSSEVRQKLDTLRPATLAQASRMEGMTPAALMLLLAHLRKPPARRSA